MRLLKLQNGAFAIVADAGAPSPPTRTSEADPADDAPVTFRAIGYRQTLKPAAAGGKANRNGFRFRNGGMSALAATFPGKPFLTGHDRNDVRARGGTITAARVEEIGDEQVLTYAIEATADWAIEGLENGTIDRFSIGVLGTGAITCTAHGTPVWSNCMCCPGELVTIKRGKAKVDVIAEWEFEGATGDELSAVNVPAVEGTGIVAVAGSEEAGALAAICGRPRPIVATPVVSAPSPAPSPTIDVELVQALGLSASASRDEILAHVAALGVDRARVRTLEAETLTAHVERELGRAMLAAVIPGDVIAELRATALTAGREHFDRSLRLVERSSATNGLFAAPPLGSAAALQSSSRPAMVPGVVQFGAEGPDAFEMMRPNANLPILMAGCGVTPDDIRKHGARKFNHEPRLQDAIDATNARGDAMGTLPK